MQSVNQFFRSIVSKNYKSIFGLLFFLGQVISIVLFLGFVHMWFTDIVEQQVKLVDQTLYYEVSTRDTLSLSQKLSTISQGEKIHCMKAYYNERVFFQYSSYGHCNLELFSIKKELFSHDTSKNLIRIELTFFLPRLIKTLIFFFLVFQVLIFSVVFFLGKKLTRVELKTEIEVAHLSDQVAHDLASPLQSLMLVLDENLVSAEHDVKQSVSLSLQRIKEIISDLNQKSAGISKNNLSVKNDFTHKSLVSDLVNSVNEAVQEKNILIQALDKKIIIKIKNKLDQSANNDFISCELKELRRILSNLIQNSIEAIQPNDGFIEVLLQSPQEGSLPGLNITISDTGRGVPEHVLKVIGKKRFSYMKEGKVDGSKRGLGVFHAFSQVKKWGGELKIQSVVNEGTSVSITLY